jgi:hypothetical protein
MSVNGKYMAERRNEKAVPFRNGDEPFNIGMVQVSPESHDSKTPNRFAGRIHKVTVEVK